MSRIPFFLVTGFLGSGKTTLVQKLLDRYSGERKMAVVQNEFAPSQVDGPALRRSGKAFELLEINNGSVFCVCLLGSFVKSLRSFVDEHRPDLILMEASGLSDPLSIGEMLNGPELGSRLYLGHIWSIVDAPSFYKLAMKQQGVQHQIRVADTVVVNKCDRLPEGDTSAIHSKVRELNPFASITDTSWCDLPLDIDPVPFGMAPVAVRQEKALASLERSGRPDIGSEVIKETRSITREQLDGFLDEVGPMAWRIKGTVKLKEGGALAIQYSFGDLRTEYLADYQGTTELIGLGPGLDGRSFGKRFSDDLGG